MSNSFYFNKCLYRLVPVAARGFAPRSVGRAGVLQMSCSAGGAAAAEAPEGKGAKGGNKAAKGGAKVVEVAVTPKSEDFSR